MMITLFTKTIHPHVKAPPAGFVAVLCALTKTVNKKLSQPVPLQIEKRLEQGPRQSKRMNEIARKQVQGEMSPIKMCPLRLCAKPTPRLQKSLRYG